MEEIFAELREIVQLIEDLEIPDQAMELVDEDHYTLDIECSRFLCTTVEKLIDRAKTFPAFESDEMLGKTLRLHFIF